MKVIFLKDLPGAGRKGEVKDVSGGYAQNFLIPKGFVQAVTPQLQAKLAKEAREAISKQEKEKTRLHALRQELEKRTFTMKVKVGDKGQVFGGIHEKDVAKAIGDKMDMVIDKNQIEIPTPVKELGIHQIIFKLGGGLLATVRLNVEQV